MKLIPTTIACVAAALLIGSAGVQTAQAANEGEMKNVETIQGFVELMKSYLAVADAWTNMLKDEDKVVFLVAEEIGQIYEKKGEPTAGIPALRKLLDEHGDSPVVRRVIHFKISEILEKAGEFDAALKELEGVLK